MAASGALMIGCWYVDGRLAVLYMTDWWCSVWAGCLLSTHGGTGIPVRPRFGSRVTNPFETGNSTSAAPGGSLGLVLPNALPSPQNRVAPVL